MTAKKVAAKKAPAKKAAAKKAPATKAPAKKAAPKSMPYEKGAWAAAFSARAPGERRYWLIKSEPDVFSFDDLLAAPKQTTCWDSVRNSSARNFLRDGMKQGDLAFYYHSNADPSAIVGICEVVREGYPDPTAQKLKAPVALPEIKASAALSEMALVKVGRLSVVPVQPNEWETVIAMSEGRS
jgi:predicted RNA-binding protein with PUA-like domain